MSYTFEQLKEDVRKEAEALKIHATKEERDRLCLSELNPTGVKACIYGLMTGHCDSPRSLELIQQCTARYVRCSALALISQDGFKTIYSNVNGVTVSNLNKKRPTIFDTEDISHYSMIEAYILLPDANNANLISFLRGETETLEL
jgi:hypothetical protein